MTMKLLSFLIDGRLSRYCHPMVDEMTNDGGLLE